MDRNKRGGNEKKTNEKEDGFWKKPKEFLGYHRTGLELLKIMHKVDSSAIPLRIMHSVVDVAGGFLGLYLTAELIDRLLEGRFSDGFVYAGALVLTELAAALWPVCFPSFMPSRPSGAPLHLA